MSEGIFIQIGIGSVPIALIGAVPLPTAKTHEAISDWSAPPLNHRMFCTSLQTSKTCHKGYLVMDAPIVASLPAPSTKGSVFHLSQIIALKSPPRTCHDSPNLVSFFQKEGFSLGL
jgi:hypothetical protein